MDQNKCLKETVDILRFSRPSEIENISASKFDTNCPTGVHSEKRLFICQSQCAFIFFIPHGSHSTIATIQMREIFINIALLSSKGAIEDGQRNFKNRSSDENDTKVCISLYPKLHTTPTSEVCIHSMEDLECNSPTACQDGS
ncbi:hypothetical protein TNCV_997901 [Trichonephila clavipes]|nr:hypothetical protein TNCV_997901 [Trichonephila clavipes]